MDQVMAGATQIVFGPADTMGIQRAWTTDAIPGVHMDRSLFITTDYVADLFGAFGRLPRKMDLAWHLRGQFASGLKMEPMEFPKPVENGYVVLKNVRHVSTDKAWTADVAREANVARFVAAGGTPTEVIVGDGVYGLETPPTIIERRNASATIFGNAIDISGTKGGFVKNVSQEGGLEKGYGLLKVKTSKGVDLCFASYRPGKFKTESMETDALQAFARMDGKQVQAVYFGGGKMLKVPGVTLERSDAGLAFIEKAETGGYVLANPSQTDATVTITMAELKGMEAFNLDQKGKRTGAAIVSKDGASVKVEMKAASKVEFAPKGVASVFEYRQGMLAKRQAQQEVALAKARSECQARTAVNEAEANAKPAPANIVFTVAASKFSAQGGGAVTASQKKRATVGDALLNWDSLGHWLEWEFEAPAEGYYNLTVCYCSELDKIERQIQVNGEVQEPFAPMVFPSTGGWSNGSDDWRLFTATNPINDKPLLIKLKPGKNVIRLTNTNDRGINVNYLAVTSPDVKVTREMLVEKLNK